jgi:ferredoxin--NADP+ reductase
LLGSKASGTGTGGREHGDGRLKKAGWGIAPSKYPEGNRALFDPDAEGMLAGTRSLDERIAGGPSYVPPSPLSAAAAAAAPPPVPAAPGGSLQDAQHWLEDLGVPLNFAKPTSPVEAAVLGRARLIGDGAPGDIQHVLMRLPPGFHYVEGQSLSVIPPGLDDSGKPHKPRLYSIASTRYGDLLDGRTVSLCVRRAVHVDPSTGLEDPTKRGVCSNYLCDLAAGQKVSVAGPVGKTMLLPADVRDRDLILVATGTGIAPFRAFLHRLFMENTVARHLYNGRAWLVLGVPTSSGVLYGDELDAMRHNAGPGQLEVSLALSREMKNREGGKLYVQDVLRERADDLLERLDGGAVLYFCGLRGMMPPVLDALEALCRARGIDWSSRLKQLKDGGQWHVEVY